MGAALAARGTARAVPGGELVVLVGPEANDEALARPHARPMDFY